MTVSKRDIGSDLDRVDAYSADPEEDDDAPELTDAFFERATYAVNGVAMPKPRVGRPPALQRKVHTGIRLDADVLDHYKSSGPGWQTRINDALRSSMGRKPLG